MNPQTVADQQREYGELLDAAKAENRTLTKKVLLAQVAAGAAILEASWILTGDAKRPTLWHLLNAAFGDWPMDDGAAKVAADLLCAFTSGQKAISLHCFKCGAVKANCICCPTHRMSADGFRPWNCADCKTTVAELAR